MTGLCLGKNTYKAKREQALAPTKRGVPPQAACDQREQLNAKRCFALTGLPRKHFCTDHVRQRLDLGVEAVQRGGGVLRDEGDRHDADAAVRDGLIDGENICAVGGKNGKDRGKRSGLVPGQDAHRDDLVALDVPEGTDRVLIFIEGAAADARHARRLRHRGGGAGLQQLLGLADLEEDLREHGGFHDIELRFRHRRSLVFPPKCPHSAVICLLLAYDSTFRRIVQVLFC